MSLLSTLGLPAPQRAAAAAAKTLAAAPPVPVPPNGGKRGQAELTLGGAKIVSQSLGPEVPGPRRTALMALMAADGSGPLQRNNSSVGGQVNRNGFAVVQAFEQLEAVRKHGYELWNDALARAKKSADVVGKLEKAARAIGQRSRDRGGSYVRGHSEDYVKSQRALEERLAEMPALQQAYDAAVTSTDRVRVEQQKLLATRREAQLKDDVEAEKKRIEEFKSKLTGIFDIAVKVVKQDWAGLAEDTGKFLVGQFADALPTARLDELKKQLEAATAHLKQLEDAEQLLALQHAMSSLRKASIDLDNGRLKVVHAVDDLRLAAKTAVEALGESSSTADAAKAIKGRAELIDVMARGRVTLEQFLAGVATLTPQIEALISMTRGYPKVVQSSANVDPEYAKSLGDTVKENLETLEVWRGWLAEWAGSARGGVQQLGDAGDGGLLQHYNRVNELLQNAIAER